MKHRSLPIHIDHVPFAVADNCLVIGGRKLTDLVADVGHTPVYLYDSQLIARRIDELRDVLPEGLSLHYAVKANPMPDVVNFIAPLVDGLDIASAKEMHVALEAGTPAKEISFAGPGKQITELEQAIDAGITVTVESINELRRLSDAGERLGKSPRAAVRVNPDFELRSSGMKMAGGPKPFGIDAEKVPAVLEEMADLPVQFVGLHIFCGSQNLRAESIIDAQKKSLALALELLRHAPRDPEFVNIGGGFGIPYFNGDERLDASDIGQNLSSLVDRLNSTLPGCTLAIELGRYIVGEAGIYVCEVIDRKESRGVTYLVTNGGLHHHLAASGNFGQVIRKNYPVAIGNRVTDEPTEVQSVVGPLCTPLDILGDKMDLPRADAGDLVVVFQSGAYGFSASPLDFLSHPHPTEHLV